MLMGDELSFVHGALQTQSTGAKQHNVVLDTRD
jgi:hypothetical protein